MLDFEDLGNSDQGLGILFQEPREPKHKDSPDRSHSKSHFDFMGGPCTHNEIPFKGSLMKRPHVDEKSQGSYGKNGQA